MNLFKSFKSARRKTFVVPKKILLISAYGLLLSLSTQMIYSHLALYLKYELHAGESQIALIDGFVEFISYLVRIFSGALSDYLHNRKLLLIIGCLLTCAIKPIFAISQSVICTLYAEIIERLGNGIQASPRDALIADLSETKSLASSFGFFRSLKTIGALLGTLVSLIVMSLCESYEILFLLSGVPALLAIFALFMIKETSIKHAKSKKFSNPFQKQYIKSLDKNFWIIIILAALCELGHSSESLLSIRASEIVSCKIAGTTAAFMGFGQAIFSYPLGLYADRYGKFFILKICLTLVILSYLLIIISNSIYILFFSILILCGQQASIQNLFLSIINEHVSARLRGTAIGIFYCTIGASYMISSKICGQLWETFGHKFSLLYSIIICSIGLYGVVFRSRYKT